MLYNENPDDILNIYNKRCKNRDTDDTVEVIYGFTYLVVLNASILIIKIEAKNYSLEIVFE